MNNITLYHGSENIIKTPLYNYGNPKNDYGMGFYCTQNIELAFEWGCSEEKDGFANEYILNTDGLSVLNLSQNNYNILNWLAILLENRTFELISEVSAAAKDYILENFLIPYRNYDIIRGYRADDSYFSFANAFLNNTISVQKLNRAMYLGKLGEQIVLKSKKAFSQIKFVSCTNADKNIYYPKKMLRDTTARKSFFQMRSEDNISDPASVFIMDIMRGGIKNDDSRIPEILFK
ncbi:MAG: DUF3990 domain-containing protein [Treponema sp.]|nr:DUF3990 domain-containing protein [Treponema sp.]MBR0486944.1 DUF3990 domain-containing protein [Treponema sp.]